MARLSKISTVGLLLSALLMFNIVDAGRGFVDRHRELQDVNMEEEVGELGHEQAVITASEKDSTTAKATSSTHVNRKDMIYKDEKATDVESNWSADDILSAEAFATGNHTLATNVAPKVDENGEEIDQSQFACEGDECDALNEAEQAPELTEEEKENVKLAEEVANIEQGFEAYAELDAAEESKKRMEKEMAKNKKKAVSRNSNFQN